MPGDVWSLLGMLAVVILILAAAYWVTRWIGTYGTRASSGVVRTAGGQENFTVLARLNLGRNEQLLLVRIGELCCLVGVAAGQITLLKELDAEQSREWIAAKAAENTAAPGFMDVLKENLRKRK